MMFIPHARHLICVAATAFLPVTASATEDAPVRITLPTPAIGTSPVVGTVDTPVELVPTKPVTLYIENVFAQLSVEEWRSQLAPVLTETAEIGPQKPLTKVAHFHVPFWRRLLFNVFPREATLRVSGNY